MFFGVIIRGKFSTVQALSNWTRFWFVTKGFRIIMNQGLVKGCLVCQARQYYHNAGWWEKCGPWVESEWVNFGFTFLSSDSPCQGKMQFFEILFCSPENRDCRLEVCSRGYRGLRQEGMGGPPLGTPISPFPAGRTRLRLLASSSSNYTHHTDLRTDGWSINLDMGSQVYCPRLLGKILRA